MQSVQEVADFDCNKKILHLKEIEGFVHNTKKILYENTTCLNYINKVMKYSMF